MPALNAYCPIQTAKIPKYQLRTNDDTSVAANALKITIEKVSHRSRPPSQKKKKSIARYIPKDVATHRIPTAKAIESNNPTTAPRIERSVVFWIPLISSVANSVQVIPISIARPGHTIAPRPEKYLPKKPVTLKLIGRILHRTLTRSQIMPSYRRDPSGCKPTSRNHRPILPESQQPVPNR